MHSLKDLTTEQPEGLTLTAMVGREDPREMLLMRPEAVDRDALAAGAVLPLKQGAKVGTSAARRQAQVRLHRPDVEILDLRGNVPTRVRKLREGMYDAILLARAGIVRLELDLADLETKPLAVDDFVPPPAQGMLGIQCRRDEALETALAPLHCPVDGAAVAAERLLLTRLDGGCQLPFGVNISGDGSRWKLELFLSADDHGANPLRLSLTGETPEAAAEMAWTKILEHRGNSGGDAG